MTTTAIKENMAQDYAHSLSQTIWENVEAGVPFGRNEDTGEELTAYDWLEDTLDILYIVTSRRQYRGAQIQLTWGGPNAWLETDNKRIVTAWGSDRGVAYLPDAFLDQLDEALSELWEMN